VQVSGPRKSDAESPPELRVGPRLQNGAWKRSVSFPSAFGAKTGTKLWLGGQFEASLQMANTTDSIQFPAHARAKQQLEKGGQTKQLDCRIEMQMAGPKHGHPAGHVWGIFGPLWLHSRRIYTAFWLHLGAFWAPSSGKQETAPNKRAVV